MVDISTTTTAAADRDAQADLIDRIAIDRDKSAFAELFTYFAPRVKAYLLRLGANDASAEEIAQDVMVAVWRKAHTFDRSQASPSTWIFRIARNRRIDAFRRDSKPDLDPHDPSLAPAADPHPVDVVEASEREQRVREAMRALPPEQLALLELAFFEGLSHRDIAAKLDAPLGTIKSRIRLAFTKLRTALGEDLI